LVFNKKENWLKLIYTKWIQWIAIVAIPALVYLTPPFLQNGIHLVYAFCFLIIITNVSFGTKSIVHCTGKVWTFLGKISYGIYMYHLMVIVFLLALLRSMGIEGRSLHPLLNVALYIGAVVLTVGLAYLSYEFFEKKWIHAKRKYTKVKSGFTIEGKTKI
jgi:peptidoglycan/LPS O-acetylase OafA/YrhL